MKKLMIAISAVALVFAANAAALNWGSVALDKDGNEFTGGQAYLVLITDATAFSVSDSLEVSGGTIVNSVGFEDSWAGGTWSTDDLTSGTKYYFAIINTTDGVAGTSVPTTGYYTVDNNGDNATTFYEVTWDANTGGAFEPNWDGSYATSMSTAVAPEPTSGLLLLIGMAGLALRRRRA